MPLNDEELAAVRDFLKPGDPASITADNAVQVLMRSHDSAFGAVDSALEAADELRTSLSRAEAERDEAKAQVISLSRGSTATPTATELYWAHKAMSAAEEAAIRSGAVTPADANEIKRKLIRKTIDPSEISLSREVQPDDGNALHGMAVCADVFEVLSKARRGPKAGETSGAQIVSMSREVPGTEGADPVERVNPYAATIARLTGK